MSSVILCALVAGLPLFAQSHMTVVLKNGRTQTFPMAEVARIEFSGDSQNVRPAADPVGVWRHGRTETWTIARQPSGGYQCQESGFGNASGPGRFLADGRFRIDYTTRDGKVKGWYEMTFAADDRAASGRWQETAGSSNSGSSNWTRVR